MAVIYNQEKRIFSLQTKNTTYQMKADQLGYLLHLYYGKRVSQDMDYLVTYADFKAYFPFIILCDTYLKSQHSP